MANRYRLIIAIVPLLTATSLQAAEWQPLGSSDVGQHFVDKNTLTWDQDKTAFSIATRVVQKDSAEWLTTLRIDCKTGTFAYLRGSESRNGEVMTHFEEPRPFEKIQPQSMPYQLSEDYCAATRPEQERGWQVLGSSRIADVSFDHASVRKNKEGTRFIADTRVIPFDKSEETLSTLSFDCNKRTFTVMKMSKLKNGEVEHIFDKPQAPTSIDKTETLATLADRVCAPSKACTEIFTKLKSIESAVQASYENDTLSCREVKSSVQKVEALNKDVKKHHCPITRLDDYMQQLKQADCH